MSTETKVKRTRKTPELKTQGIIESFDKLPFDEKLKVLAHVSTKTAEEKATIRKQAEATLEKYK